MSRHPDCLPPFKVNSTPASAHAPAERRCRSGGAKRKAGEEADQEGRRQRLGAADDLRDDPVLDEQLEALGQPRRQLPPALHGVQMRRCRASRSGTARMLAAATASWMARLMPTARGRRGTAPAATHCRGRQRGRARAPARPSPSGLQAQAEGRLAGGMLGQELRKSHCGIKARNLQRVGRCAKSAIGIRTSPKSALSRRAA